jgi:PRC-barrel domain
MKGENYHPHARVGDGYWLRHCHGYRVDSRSGRIGIVEDVLYGAEHDRPAALAVRGGLLGRRLELVPVEEVDAIHPQRKRLVVRTPAGHRPSL